MQFGRTVTALAALAGITIGAPGVAVAGGRGALWYVDVDGPACISERATLEREITLACNAVGGTCGVVAAPADAELRATLRCPSAEESWALETQTVDGVPLSRVELVGAREDRLREAGVEVARDVAPERTLAAETLRDTLVADKDNPPRKRHEPLVSLAFGGRGSFDGAAQGGARLLAGLRVVPETFATFGVTGLVGGSGTKATRNLRLGLGGIVGSPFGRWPFGLGVEVGVDVAQRYPNTVGTASSSVLSPVVTSSVYGSTSFYVQYPRGMVRPFAAFAATLFSNPLSNQPASSPSSQPHLAVSADAGLAFALF